MANNRQGVQESSQPCKNSTGRVVLVVLPGLCHFITVHMQNRKEVFNWLQKNLIKNTKGNDLVTCNIVGTYRQDRILFFLGGGGGGNFVFKKNEVSRYHTYCSGLRQCD